MNGTIIDGSIIITVRCLQLNHEQHRGCHARSRGVRDKVGEVPAGGTQVRSDALELVDDQSVSLEGIPAATSNPGPSRGMRRGDELHVDESIGHVLPKVDIPIGHLKGLALGPQVELDLDGILVEAQLDEAEVVLDMDVLNAALLGMHRRVIRAHLHAHGRDALGLKDIRAIDWVEVPCRQLTRRTWPSTRTNQWT